MKTFRVENTKTHCVIGEHIRLASNPWLRFRGLMGVRSLAVGEGMLFPRTNAVHGFFMRIPLRLVYLNKQQEILRVALLQPWRIGPVVPKAYWVMELPGETPLEDLEPGTALTWR